MTLKFEPAPTYADPIIVEEATGRSKFNPLWLKWFLSVVQVFNSLLEQSTGGVINHEALTGLLGGTTNAHYHVDVTEHAFVVGASANGISVTITTAKLTGGGANGSMTFTNGVLTAQTAAT